MATPANLPAATARVFLMAYEAGDRNAIADAGASMACPDPFVVTLDGGGPISRVLVWCDQITPYRRLGYPAGPVAARAA